MVGAVKMKECKCGCQRSWPVASTKWLQWRKIEKQYDFYRQRKYYKFDGDDDEFKTPFRCLEHAMIMRNKWLIQNGEESVAF